MKRGASLIHLAVALVVWLAVAQTAWGNLVVNGGFEEGLEVGWQSSLVDRTPGTSLGITYFNPYEGNYALDLEGSGGGNLSGNISQGLTTTPGTSYALQFAMGGNYWNWSDYIKNPSNPLPTIETKHLQVFWNGTSLGTFSYSLHAGDTITNFTWDLHELVIPGAQVMGGDSLRFASINPTYAGYGAFVDNITVTSAPVPEASSLLLLASGLAGLGGMVWWRHRK